MDLKDATPQARRRAAAVQAQDAISGRKAKEATPPAKEGKKAARSKKGRASGDGSGKKGTKRPRPAKTPRSAPALVPVTAVWVQCDRYAPERRPGPRPYAG